jgi:hypothetical protein
MAKHNDFSGIPAAVLKQKRAADKLAGGQGEPEPALEEGNTGNQEPNKPADPEPVVTEPAQLSPAIPDGNSDTWEQKYRVIQGKYDKEIAALRGDLADAKAMLERQNVVIENLNSKQTELESTPGQGNLDPDDFESWGEEMQGMVKLVNSLKATVASQNETIQKLSGGSQPDPQLNQRLESLETDAYQSRVDNYLDFLDKHIKGDWRIINKTTQFSAWLDGQDPVSLQPRRDVLMNAADNFRGAQVASIFNLYIEQNGVDSGVTVASDLPGGSASGNTGDTKPRETTSIIDLKKAEKDFIKGQITQEEFAAISAKVQKSLRS